MISEPPPKQRPCSAPFWIGICLVGFLFLSFSAKSEAADAFPLVIEAPSVAPEGIPFPLVLTAPHDSETARVPYELRGSDGEVLSDGWVLRGGSVEISALPTIGPKGLVVYCGAQSQPIRVRSFPGWLSLLPAALAILLALLFRQVVPALLAGVWLGAFLVEGYRPFYALIRIADGYLMPAMADADHASIMLFTLMLGGMVGVISRNGGTAGIVESVSRWATSARKGQVATWLMGMLVFFDDYANTLVVGNTMRPLTDRLKISREKLSYLVDSTAAPIASIAVISTWIGFEVSLIGDSLSETGWTDDPYLIFLRSLPYRFYPILTLLFVLVVGAMGRDFGPMGKAERRARNLGQVFRPGSEPLSSYEGSSLNMKSGIPRRWINAALPVGVMILTTVSGLFVTGLDSLREAQPLSTDFGIREIIAAADSFRALLWASFLGSLCALVLTVIQKLLSVRDSLDAWFSGVRSMVMAMAILVLAWSIGEVCADLGTSLYVADLASGVLSPRLLPALTFLAAAAISFATGTSWGTLSILMPIVVPLAWRLAGPDGAALPGGGETILLGTVSSVLAGAVFGDHCSPVSDTTVMSSVASGADHIDHVRTQMPYACVAASLGLLLGDLPTAYGVSPFICLGISSLCVVVVVRWVGRPSDTS